MSEKSLDTFIASSLSLLEANASGTKLTISYNPKFHHTPVVSFRAKNDTLDLHYKYKTSKSKNVSRALSAMGPVGVNLPFGRVAKKLYKAKSKDVTGMSTLLVNQEVKTYVEPETADKRVEASKSKKSKKQKKKAKK